MKEIRLRNPEFKEPVSGPAFATELGNVAITNEDLADFYRENGVTTKSGREVTSRAIAATTRLEARYSFSTPSARIITSEELKGISVPLATRLTDSVIGQKRWNPQSVDYIVFCTSYPFGEEGSRLVALSLGMNPGSVKTQDIYAACSSSVRALDYLNQVAKRGDRVVIAAVEGYHGKMGTSIDRSLFSEGGSATAFVWGEELEIVHTDHHDETSAELNEAISFPYQEDLIPRGAIFVPVPYSGQFTQNGPAVLDWVLQNTPTRMVIDAIKFIPDQTPVDVVAHQGSVVMLTAWQTNFEDREIRANVSARTISRYGNLAAASTLAEYHAYKEQVRPEPGTYAILVGMGAGLSTSVAVIKEPVST